MCFVVSVIGSSEDLFLSEKVDHQPKDNTMAIRQMTHIYVEMRNTVKKSDGYFFPFVFNSSVYFKFRSSKNSPNDGFTPLPLLVNFFMSFLKFFRFSQIKRIFLSIYLTYLLKKKRCTYRLTE